MQQAIDSDTGSAAARGLLTRGPCAEKRRMVRSLDGADMLQHSARRAGACLGPADQRFVLPGDAAASGRSGSDASLAEVAGGRPDLL